MSESTPSLLEFPCQFPVKAMGLSSPPVKQVIVDIVRNHAPEITEEVITVKASSGGKYTSITIVIKAKNQQQLDAIYQDLTDCEQVLIAL